MKQLWIVALLAGMSAGSAEELRGITAGVHVGTSLNARSETFRQVEAALEFTLPWKWDLTSNLHLQTRLDVAGGWLRGEQEEAIIGKIGPAGELAWKDFPLSLDFGSSPTLISRHEFGRRDYGIPFQFTTHAGVNWDVTRHIRFSYRYQHMSNAGLGDPNPGLNLHMLGLSYRF